MQISQAKGSLLRAAALCRRQINLGARVIVQRYRKDDLSVERKKRLDRIGFVWNWRDFAWERGFATLLEFRRREGHCRVPPLYREGKYKLGRCRCGAAQKEERNVAQTKSAVK